MLGLRSLKHSYPWLYHLLDIFLVFFLLFPCVVAFWTGTWAVLDVFYLPHHLRISIWSNVVFGVALLTFLNVIQFDLTNHFLNPKNSFRNIIVKRLYTLFAGVANALLWRGVWIVQDEYSDITVNSGLFSVLFGTTLLVILRSSCNGIAAPLGTAFDEHDSFFIMETRFHVQNNNKFLLFWDSLFSVAIVGTLVVFEWRGTWVLFDLLLFPDNQVASVVSCLVFGYLVCLLVDAAQNHAVAVSAYLDKQSHWLWKVAFEDVYLLVAKLGTLAAWRGIWIMWDELVIMRPVSGVEYRVWIPVIIGYVIPTLLQHANSLIVLEVVLDGGMTEGQGCKVKVTMLDNLLKFWCEDKVLDKRLPVQEEFPAKKRDDFSRENPSSPRKFRATVEYQVVSMTDEVCV